LQRIIILKRFIQSYAIWIHKKIQKPRKLFNIHRNVSSYFFHLGKETRCKKSNCQKVKRTMVWCTR